MILDALPRLAASTRVVLASASPRRAELLRQLGITKFEVRPSSFAEDLPKTTDGATYARATACWRSSVRPVSDGDGKYSAIVKGRGDGASCGRASGPRSFSR